MAVPHHDPVELFLNRVKGVQRRSGGWIAQCPAHEDAQASLKVDRGDDGRLLLHCHAGCKTEDILSKVGLSWSDAFTGDRIKEPTPITKKRGAFDRAYDYVDADGTLICQSIRYKNPKGFNQRRPDGNGEWIWRVSDLRWLPLYRLPQINALDREQWIAIVEGEKDADRAWQEGMPATTNAMGAGKWRPEYSEQLRGRSIAIIADNDGPGEKHARLVARSTHGIVQRARMITLPGLSTKGDLSDWLDAGHTVSELQELIAATPDWTPFTEADDSSEEKLDGGKKPRKSQATLIFEIARELAAELWHTSNGEEFASIEQDGHIEHHQLRLKPFRDLIAKSFYDRHEAVPGAQATQDAINALCGVAKFDGPEYPVYTRNAWHEGVLYIDRGADDWEIVRIDAQGWQLITSADCPVKFRRSHSTGILPRPIAGGSLSDLWALFEIDDESGTLIPAWTIGCYQPHGARAHLEVIGPQGSGKTTMLRMVVNLIDPSEVEVRSAPKDEESLIIAVRRRAVLAIDNLSKLPADQADAMSRLSTGGGLGRRELYSNDEEILLRAQLPVAWTGINSVIANYADLQDRTLTVSMKGLDGSSYQSEYDLWQQFHELQPKLLGALYDAVSVGIRRMGDISLDQKPRLADFATWVEATAPAFGWAEGEFTDAYAASRAKANELAVESSPVGEILVHMMKEEERWEGTAADLLAEIRKRSDDERKRLRGFPKQANHLSNHLKRLRPSLRGIGVWIEFERSAAGRKIVLMRDDKHFQQPEPEPDVSEPSQAMMDMSADRSDGATCLEKKCTNPVAAGSAYYCEKHGGGPIEEQEFAFSAEEIADARHEAETLQLSPDEVAEERESLRVNAGKLEPRELAFARLILSFIEQQEAA